MSHKSQGALLRRVKGTRLAVGWTVTVSAIRSSDADEHSFRLLGTYSEPVTGSVCVRSAEQPHFNLTATPQATVLVPTLQGRRQALPGEAWGHRPRPTSQPTQSPPATPTPTPRPESHASKLRSGGGSQERAPPATPQGGWRRGLLSRQVHISRLLQYSGPEP